MTHRTSQGTELRGKDKERKLPTLTVVEMTVTLQFSSFEDQVERARTVTGKGEHRKFQVGSDASVLTWLYHLCQ